MQINRENYVQLKRLMIDETIQDVNSVYQLGTDQLSKVRLHDDYQQLIQTLSCFKDNAAVHDVRQAQYVLNRQDNTDAEDQIESWLDRANLD